MPANHEEHLESNRICLDSEGNARDPRTMERAELERAGHHPMSPTKVIRAMCLDCAYTASEVAKCVCTSCPLWPWRTGKNPWRNPRHMSAEKREALAARGRRLAALRKQRLERGEE